MNAAKRERIEQYVTQAMAQFEIEVGTVHRIQYILV
jgi:hypothetical protein